MPRGKFTNHKGRARRFTSPEELEEQSKQDQFKERHTKKAAESDAESEENDASDASESESENEGKGKGVEKLIEVENPNRIQKKAKKLSSLNQVTSEPGKPELSRREREELEKQRAYMHYTKLHAEGKTEEARADLARLAIIKKQREEAAAKREAEKQAKEAAKQAKTAQTLKAIGKKT